MISIKKIAFLSLISCVIIGCNVNKTATAIASESSTENSTKTENLSIGEILTKNNHLPIEERIALYHQLKKENPGAYNFKDEKELNDYGYALLNADLKEEAVEIFKLNVEQFPNSADVHYNLADAYSNVSYHYRELSKENREKALEIWSILEMEETWGMEIFHFPLRFAKEINYTGIEEARFPPKGWADTTSNYFWTYLFAWEINIDSELTVEELEADLILYYDGLMNSMDRDETIDSNITTAALQKQNTVNGTQFIGKVKTFDAFTTHQSIVLNIIIDYNYCKQEKTTQLLFMLSPEPFESDVWTELKTAKFRKEICK